MCVREKQRVAEWARIDYYWETSLGPGIAALSWRQVSGLDCLGGRGIAEYFEH